MRGTRPAHHGAVPRFPLILCYHKVERRRELGVTRLSPRRFARQVERLARDGWRTLTLAQLHAVVRGERACGERELVITFDDAYRGLREHAFPVLRDHGFGAVVGVITDYAGRLNRWDVAYGGRRFAHLAWRDLRAWQAQGVEVVSHTATHPRMTWLASDDVRRELVTSRRAIRDALDVDTTTVAWPFGAAREREWALAREAGYSSGMLLAGGEADEPLALPRLPVYMWSPPRPGTSVLGPLEWFVADVANRCAVGTTLLQASGSAVRRSSARSPGAASDAARARG